MTELPFPSLVPERFEQVSLPEINEVAEFLSRRDRKYLLDLAAADRLLRALSPATRILAISGETAQSYQSIYFDTPDGRSYHDTATRRRRRFKVRLRRYPQSGLTMLEVKIRSPRGLNQKHRIETAPMADRLDSRGHEFIAQVLLDNGVPAIDPRLLRPVLTSRYQRLTLLSPDGAGRVTIDWDVELRAETGLRLTGIAVVESKSGIAAPQFDRELWTAGLRPVRFSKYGTGLALLDPSLPANKWHRTIQLLTDHRRRAA